MVETLFTVTVPPGNGYSDPAAMSRIVDHLTQLGLNAEFKRENGLLSQNNQGAYTLVTHDDRAASIVPRILSAHYGLKAAIGGANAEKKFDLPGIEELRAKVIETGVAVTRSEPNAGLLQNITGGSEYSNCQHVGRLLSGGPAVGYETLACWLDQNCLRAVPSIYVVLLAEAAVAGVAPEIVNERFPQAKHEASICLNAASSYRSKLMGGKFDKVVPQTLAQFYDSPAAYPDRSETGLPNTQTGGQSGALRKLQK